MVAAQHNGIHQDKPERTKQTLVNWLREQVMFAQGDDVIPHDAGH